eukprot:TRINITY_DN63925_c0_g1_i1.p1 TRINITY_DN63925_c0_g1~~TRINITY_DN63925_c0_g1_i1.p1  ORF type:complete len:674 (-),score=248.49 TRINITY_DN63925_c0_g1_i1:147-2168(-)
MMKVGASVVLSALALQAEAKESPVNRVVTFIKDLKQDCLADKDAEAKSFKEYQDWCDGTKDKANKDIEDDTKVIAEATETVNSLAGATAATRQNIAYAQKSIKENQQRTATADKIRGEEKVAFEAVEKELKESIAAMDAGAEALGGGESFLQQRKVPLPEVMQRITRVLLQSSRGKKLAPEDMKLLQKFASGQPAAEYQSATGQVTKIIEQTGQDFKDDLKDATDIEHERIAAYTKLSKTLAEELASLQNTVATETANNAEALKAYTDAFTLRETTESEKHATTTLLDDTTLACQKKLEDYQTRTKLRDQELDGINKALEILEDEQSKSTFAKAAEVMSPSFIQVNLHSETPNKAAYAVLQKAAAKFASPALAQVAVKVLEGAGGHFDKVIDTINKQIDHLRAEEQEDEDHRDLCQKQLAKQDADIVELTHTIDKLGAKIGRQAGRNKELEAEIAALETSMTGTNTEMEATSKERDDERKTHVEALKHDKEGLRLVKEATEALGEFYRKNKIDKKKPTLAQVSKSKKALPDGGFQDKNYEGKKDATNGLFSMLDMLTTDMQEEIDTSIKQDAEAQAAFEKTIFEMKAVYDAEEAKKIAAEKELADTERKKDKNEQKKSDTEDEKSAAKDAETELKKDCAWVKDNFASRRTKRQAEIESLVDAKGLLATGGKGR